MLPYMIMLEGYDKAFEGFYYNDREGLPAVAIYNNKKLIKIIMEQKNYDYDKAVEFSEQVLQTMWKGDDAPIIYCSCTAKQFYKVSHYLNNPHLMTDE